MNVQIEENWRGRLQEEFDNAYFERLVQVGGIVSPLVGLGNILHFTAIVMVTCSFIVLGLMCKNE